ncbi:hypothetical protein YC2023_002753 [Brassica napus]
MLGSYEPSRTCKNLIRTQSENFIISKQRMKKCSSCGKVNRVVAWSEFLQSDIFPCNTVLDDYLYSFYVYTNVLRKINAKLGGLNCMLTMELTSNAFSNTSSYHLVGMDVSHGTQDSLLYHQLLRL